MKGKKDDNGKLDYTLLPLKGLEETVRVLMHGEQKYGRENWKEVKPFKERYTKALLRHVIAYANDDVVDKESGLHHLAHAVCNCLFLLSEGVE